MSDAVNLSLSNLTKEDDVAGNHEETAGANTLDYAVAQFKPNLPMSSPADRLRQLFSTKILADTYITLRNNNKRYATHKLILAMTSPAFEHLLSGKEFIREMTCDYEPDAFEWFLEHAYSSNTNFPENIVTLMNVYRLLEKLEMKNVLEKLRKHMGNNLTSDNIDDFYDLAVCFEDSKLQMKCYEYVTNNCSSILKKSQSGAVSRRVLKLALRKNTGGKSETELFTIAVAWAKKQLLSQLKQATRENLRKKLETILSEIDFLSMELDDLMKTVYEANIFTEGELRAIILLSHEISENPKSDNHKEIASYPVELSKRRKKREHIQGNASGTIRHCQLVMNLKCSHKIVWCPANGTELAALQVSKNIQLCTVKARSECYLGITHLEVYSHILLKKSAAGPPWKFDTPLNLDSSQTYKFILSGPGKIVKHDSKMFSVMSSRIEFCGQCIACDINVGYRLVREDA